MLPATGSTMTQAMRRACFSNSALICVESLNCATRVCDALSAGTPAELGWPKVSAPEPALTSSESAWP